jgi:hypothetical protein
VEDGFKKEKGEYDRKKGGFYKVDIIKKIKKGNLKKMEKL